MDLEMKEKAYMSMLNKFRGFFAVLILIGHCSEQMTQRIWIVDMIHKTDMLSVGYFFMISAFSLSYNLKRKKDYLKGFLINKPFYFLLTVFLFEFVNKIAWKIVHDKPIAFHFQDLLTWNWYIYEIIVFYFLFYLIGKMNLDRKIKILIFFIGSLLISIVAFIIGYGPEYYSTFGFFYGIIFYEYFNEITKLIEKYFFYAGIIGFLILGIGTICLRLPRDNYFSGCILHNIAVLGFLILWIIFSKLLIQKCRLQLRWLDYLSAISLEIYLYHFMWLMVVNRLFEINDVTKDIMYLLAVMFFTLLSVIPIFFVDKYIKGMLRKCTLILYRDDK